MMYRDYWVCPDCGAALDPDEKCNCHDRRPAAYCFMCAMPLYPEDALYDQDPAYEIDGHVLCEDCVDKYVEKNCRKVLPFVTVPNDYGMHRNLY